MIHPGDDVLVQCLSCWSEWWQVARMGQPCPYCGAWYARYVQPYQNRNVKCGIITVQDAISEG